LGEDRFGVSGSHDDVRFASAAGRFDAIGAADDERVHELDRRFDELLQFLDR